MMNPTIRQNTTTIDGFKVITHADIFFMTRCGTSSPVKPCDLQSASNSATPPPPQPSPVTLSCLSSDSGIVSGGHNLARKQSHANANIRFIIPPRTCNSHRAGKKKKNTKKHRSHTANQWLQCKYLNNNIENLRM